MLRKHQQAAIDLSIDNNFSSGIHSHATGTGKSIIGLEKLKITYDNDSEIVARLIICTNKLSKVFENLKDNYNKLGSNDIFNNYNLNCYYLSSVSIDSEN